MSKVDELNDKINEKVSSIKSIEAEIASTEETVEVLKAELKTSEKLLKDYRTKLELNKADLDILQSELSIELAKNVIPKLSNESFKAFVQCLAEQSKEHDIDFFSIFCNKEDLKSCSKVEDVKLSGLKVKSEDDLMMLYNLYVSSKVEIESFEINGVAYNTEAFLSGLGIKGKRMKRLMLRAILYKVLIENYYKNYNTPSVRGLFNYLAVMSTGGYMSYNVDGKVVDETSVEGKSSKQYLVYKSGNEEIYAGEPYDCGLRFFICILGTLNAEKFDILSSISFNFDNEKLQSLGIKIVDGGVVYEAE